MKETIHPPFNHDLNEIFHIVSVCDIEIEPEDYDILHTIDAKREEFFSRFPPTGKMLLVLYRMDYIRLCVILSKKTYGHRIQRPDIFRDMKIVVVPDPIEPTITMEDPWEAALLSDSRDVVK